MVGVPGRSKGCHNCRQRRIKCDGQLPGCRNCAKTKRTCSGYQRQHAFVMWNNASGASPISVGQSPSSSSEPEAPSMAMISGKRTDQSSSRASTSSPSELSASPVEVPLTLHLFQEISTRNLFRDRIFSLFVENDMSLSQDMKLAFSERSNWMVQSMSLSDLSPALENALLAAFSARLGHYANKPALRHESLKLYTTGLRELRRSLLDTSSKTDEQCVAACLALLLYEITECPGGTPDAYMAHYHGMMQLIRAQGPGAFTTGLPHGVFPVLRLHSLFQSIIGRKNSFLAEPEWREIPWSILPDSKTPFDHLVDVLLEIPGLSGLCKEAEGTSQPSLILSKALRAIGEGERLEASLARWFNWFETIAPGPFYSPQLSKIESAVDNPESGKLFPVAFHFSSFPIGQILIYYWMGVMSVQAHLCFTYARLAKLVTELDGVGRSKFPCTCNEADSYDSDDGTTQTHCLRHFTMDSIPPLGQRQEWPWTTAYNICQSTEYFIDSERKGFGPATVIPALALVGGFWGAWPGDWSRHKAWIDDMLWRIRTSGSEIAGTWPV